MLLKARNEEEDQEKMATSKKRKPRTKKKGTVKDSCYHKVKRTYKVFPSAYASGAIAKCRKRKGK